MNTNNKVRPIKILLKTEQFKRLIDNVLSEQVMSNNKKLIKSTTSGKEK